MRRVALAITVFTCLGMLIAASAQADIKGPVIVKKLNTLASGPSPTGWR